MIEIIEPNVPMLTDEDVLITEENVAQLISSASYRGKVQPTEETAHLSRKDQHRSKYNHC